MPNLASPLAIPNVTPQPLTASHFALWRSRRNYGVKGRATTKANGGQISPLSRLTASLIKQLTSSATRPDAQIVGQTSAPRRGRLSDYAKTERQRQPKCQSQLTWLSDWVSIRLKLNPRTNAAFATDSRWDRESWSSGFTNLIVF